MTASEPFLKTQQVARALGVSVATVKRWVDDGKIRAARTSGKHRLIPISEVKRMAREIGKDLPGADGLVDLIPGTFRADDPRVLAALTDLLREGKGPEARALIRAVTRFKRDAVELADHLIRPVMERIGHGWMVGSLDVYQEHQATAILAAAIQERIDELSLGRVSPSPLALGATTEGDFYLLSGLLGELLLREQGWAVRNLGTNLPLRSLANATREYRPRLIFLTINYLKDEERFIREYLAFHETAVETEAAVIIGGRALRPELRSQLPYSAFGDRMANLAEFARRLAPRASNGPESPSA